VKLSVYEPVDNEKEGGQSIRQNRACEACASGSPPLKVSFKKVLEDQDLDRAVWGAKVFLSGALLCFLGHQGLTDGEIRQFPGGGPALAGWISLVLGGGLAASGLLIVGGEGRRALSTHFLLNRQLKMMIDQKSGGKRA
jgi:hypothetical protein